MSGVTEPPARIVTERLVLRPFRAADAELAKDAVDSSLEHLRTFMAWAWEAPLTIEEGRELLDGFGRAFDRGEDCVFGVFASDESELVGGAGLHKRGGPGSLEIGYWIRASRVRQGLATETAGALTRVAFELCGVALSEIHVDPANLASQGVAERLGYVREAILRRRLPPVGPDPERRDKVVFSLLAEEYPDSPSAAITVEGLS